MQRAAMAFLAGLLLVACGSSDDESGGDWCDAVPALTTDSRTDRTGKANTYRRVLRVHDRYAMTLLDNCPGVTSVGIGKTRPSAAVNNPKFPPARAKRLSDREPDHVLGVGLLAEDDRPDQDLYLNGVRLDFHITGEIRAG